MILHLIGVTVVAQVVVEFNEVYGVIMLDEVPIEEAAQMIVAASTDFVESKVILVAG
jgi:hypothetical protein